VQVAPAEVRAEARAPDDVLDVDNLTVLEQRQAPANPGDTRHALDADGGEIGLPAPDQRRALRDDLRAELPADACVRPEHVHCRVDAAVARERVALRAHETAARRAVHGDYSLLEPFDSFKKAFESFDPISLPVPSLEVDTTDGYDPSAEQIVAFVNRS
jgi:hypothetical protein